MRRLLYDCESLKWIDLAHPSREELADIQNEYQLHPAFVQDCLDPVHLPKYERTGNVTFLIVRIFDVESDPQSDSVQSLTRKVAIFLGNNFIITVHRVDPEYFQNLTQRCLSEIEQNPMSPALVLVKFINRALRSYHIPLDKAEDELDVFESALFDRNTVVEMFKGLHIVRRRLALIKRILLHSQDVIQRLSPTGDSASPLFQDLRENVASLIFLTDELVEDATNLLSLQITLSAQKTNEVMRILTVFSVFFMPLTFIVGVYGMNFRVMPELDWKYGYALIWILMISTTLLIAWWFKKKGWLNLGQ